MTKEDKDRPTPLRVRISPAVHAALKKKAKSAGRSLTQEMGLRLAASVCGELGPTALYEGWPTNDERRFRSLANIVGLLCARIALTTGTDTPHSYVLGAMREALSDLFNRLNAAAIDVHQEKFFAMLGRQMWAEINQAANAPNPSGEKAAFAEFATAWGVKPKKGKDNETKGSNA